MNSTTVESTALAAVAYEESQQALQLEFRSGALYEYLGVPADVHEELLDSASKGSYFNRAIRERYSYRLLVNAEAGTSNGALRAEGAR